MQNSEPVRLARYAIEKFLDFKVPPTLPEWVSQTLRNERAGCFVSLHTHEEALRGCIGTLTATKKNLALEIVENAVSAAARDPRFPPLEREELDHIDISVDVLTEPEETTAAGLDPKKYGVIVQHDWRKGVLLPDLEGVNTVREQLEIALAKAGIKRNETYSIFRFTVKRYH